MTDQPSTSRTRSDRWVGVDPSQDETPRPPLTRPRIVRTALRLVDQQDLSALTMRALATELQVSPMALYNHVRDKDELVELMVDVMLGEVDLSATEGDWLSQLRGVVCSYHHVLAAHSGLARIYSTGVSLGPHGLLLMERVLGLLLQAGFAAPDAADAFFTLYTYTAGFHQMGRVNPLDYAALPPEQIPAVTAVNAHLSGARRRGRYEYGLDTLLTGLQTAHTAKLKSGLDTAMS